MTGRPPNRLIQEKSPYLLQHAENPVDWYPWGEEAFAKAQKEHKPIFLSIGYSTCHWCHVMAHESFEDSEVAELINDTFISIKVDREERPDIDKIYMSVCQMMTGTGGWPLTIIMTPDKEPFFAATYIPKGTSTGQGGLFALIPRIKEMWTQRQAEVLSSANQVREALQKTAPNEPGGELNDSILHLSYEQLAAQFDEKYGGFGIMPKFPTPQNLTFLLRYWKRTGNEKALSMVEKTLQAMRWGGIYDHIGFGFHRYATDPRWLVPHFEKMLYDQAMIAMAYIEAYQVTGKDDYARTVHEIFSYVLRDMTAAEGGFYSAEDADSEGKEGKFYLWTDQEIRQVLTAEEAELAVKVFNIKENGNFRDESTLEETGNNILQVNMASAALAAALNLSLSALEQQLGSIRNKLFSYREQRIHPHKDDKVLTDWNGLMIAALAKGARVFNEASYASAAQRATGFIFENMLTADGRLLHRYRGGQAELPAYLDNYAFVIMGLLELYETTFDAGYLRKALDLNEILLDYYWDDDNGGFFFTAHDSESLLIRKKEIYDGAIPSGNSVAMLNLLRLGRITFNPDLEEKATKIGRAFSQDVRQMPSSYAQLMVAVDFAAGPAYEVVIAGDSQAADTREILEAINRRFIPNKVVLLRPAEQESPDIDRLSPVGSYQASPGGKTIVYVCSNYSCQLPTTDIGKVLELLGV